MIAVVWRFKVHPSAASEFQRHYSSNGTWSGLFRSTPAYRGTQLLQDSSDTSIYLTIDTWDDLSSYETFKRENERYHELDRSFECLTMEEQHVGTFEVL